MKMEVPMQLEMSEANSKRVLSGIKWIANVGQNYLASLNNRAKPNSSIKKLINALLFVPIIVPTVITMLLIGCAFFLLNAVNGKDGDSKLSKVSKFIVRSIIYIAAAVVLIPCIMLNLVNSLLPILIFQAINKDIFNTKNTNIEGNQNQTVNAVLVNSSEEYNKLIEEKTDELRQQNDVNHALVNSSRCNQPTVEIISRVAEDKRSVDQTIIAKNIKYNRLENCEVMMRTIGDDHNFTVNNIVVGGAANQLTNFASAMKLSCNVVKNGIDMQFGCSVRTGKTKQKATQALMKSRHAQTILSSNNGEMLPKPIEQPGNSKQN